MGGKGESCMGGEWGMKGCMRKPCAVSCANEDTGVSDLELCLKMECVTSLETM